MRCAHRIPAACRRKSRRPGGGGWHRPARRRALAQLGEQRFAGVDDHAAAVAAGGAALPERAGGAGVFREAHGLTRRRP